MNKLRIAQYALLTMILGPIVGSAIYGSGKAIAQAVNSTGVSTSTSGATKVTVTTPPNDVVSGPTNLTGTGTVTVSAQGSGSVGIIVTGTGSGMTFTFQGSVDGTNYVTIPCVVPTTGAIATGGTANGTWTCQAAGYQNVRVNLSAISGGTFTATLNASAGSNQPPIGTQGTSTNVTAYGGTSVDPCLSVAPTYTPISITSATTTRIVAPTSAKKTYVCYMFLLSAIANNVGIVEGTGGTCGSSTAGVVGGTTAANGINLAANSGAVFQEGGFAALATAGTNVDLCLITSAAGPVAGHIKWVQAP